MENNKKLLGFYDYTVILTYIGMLTGFVGITLITNGKFKEAVICLMISGVCDMFDGAIANTKDRNVNEKKFGIQIDSLSDLICFGVLPAMLVYKMNENNILGFSISAGYLLCALIRLAYFNICEEKRQSENNEVRKVYQGLPVTSSALIIPAVYVMTDRNIYFIPILAIMGLLFLVPFKIKKPKIIGKITLSLIGMIEIISLVLLNMGDI